jgi:hypothetical protein
MARVSGPFMSVDASGTIYGLLVASIWKGRNYIRGHVIPTNPKTDAQKTVREALAAAVLEWQGLSAVMPDSGGAGAETYKDQWNIAAGDVQPPISGYNYFVMQYCLTGPSPTIPATAPTKSKSIHGRNNYGLDRGYE